MDVKSTNIKQFYSLSYLFNTNMMQTVVTTNTILVVSTEPEFLETKKKYPSCATNERLLTSFSDGEPQLNTSTFKHFTWNYFKKIA